MKRKIRGVRYTATRLIPILPKTREFKHHVLRYRLMERWGYAKHYVDSAIKQAYRSTRATQPGAAPGVGKQTKPRKEHLTATQRCREPVPFRWRDFPTRQSSIASWVRSGEEKRAGGPDELSRGPSVMNPKKNGSFVTVFQNPRDKPYPYPIFSSSHLAFF